MCIIKSAKWFWQQLNAKVLILNCRLKMDLFSGWPFSGSRGFWDEPGYGYYGTRPRIPTSFYDTNPFYSEAPEWYGGMSNFPLHRASKHRSPFERNNCTPFDNVFADRTCYPRNNTARSHVEPELPNTPVNSQSVAMEKGVAKLKKLPDAPAVSPSTTDICQ